MTDVKARLHGRVQERKKKGAERLRAILDVVKQKGVVTEGELAAATGLEKKDLHRYVEYLKEKGIVDVKKRLMKDAEISVAGGVVKAGAQNPAEEKQAAEPQQPPGQSQPEQPEPEQPTPQHEPTPQPEPPPVEPEPAPEPQPEQPTVEKSEPEEKPVPRQPPQPAPEPESTQQEPAPEPEPQPEPEPRLQPEQPRPQTRPQQPVPESGPDEALVPEKPPATAARPQQPVAEPEPEEVTEPKTQPEPELTEKPEPPHETEQPAPPPEPEQPAEEVPAAEGLETPTPEEKPVEEEAAAEEKPGEMVVSGERVMPVTEEEFREIVKSLTTDFVGVMRLSGEIDGTLYTAGLLIDKGNIIASSLENMETVEITYGDDAMSEIQTRFAGTHGDLEIFEMTEDDLDNSLQSNVNYLLSKPVKLSSLKIKIKSKMKKQEPEKKSMLSGIKSVFSKGDAEAKEERMKTLKEKRQRKVGKIGGGINLVDFARDLKLDPRKAKRFEELRKKREDAGPVVPEKIDERKAARLEELKARRRGALQGIASAVTGGEARKDELRRQREGPEIKLEQKEEKPVKRVQEGRKIETSIDQLYELVESQGRLKLNDALAAKLKVNKTQIEEWAMILEEHNLLELRYPTIGEPEIISHKADKKGKDDSNGKAKK